MVSMTLCHGSCGCALAAVLPYRALGLATEKSARQNLVELWLVGSSKDGASGSLCLACKRGTGEDIAQQQHQQLPAWTPLADTAQRSTSTSEYSSVSPVLPIRAENHNVLRAMESTVAAAYRNATPPSLLPLGSENIHSPGQSPRRGCIWQVTHAEQLNS